MSSEKSTPDEFYDYLNHYLEDSNYNDNPKQIIRLIFTFGYKGLSRNEILKKKNQERYYKPYTTQQMLQLCDDFTRNELKENVDFIDLIHDLKEKIEQKIPLL